MHPLSTLLFRPTPRALLYLGVTLLLGLAGFWLRGFQWQGSQSLHTLMEALATLLAFYVGTLALIRYFSQRDVQFLYIGAGFIGTAMLDGYHALVTSAFFQPFMPSDNVALVPWSWLASRIYLSVLMVLSWLLWLVHRDTPDFRPNHVRVLLITATTTLAMFFVFAFTPLPPFMHQDWLFPRPFDLLPGLLFVVALAGYLHKGKWRSDAFEHWLVLSLIVGATMQISFMSLSGALYDLEFDLAHLLKKLSYILVLTGLMVSLQETYAQIIDESNRRRQAEQDLLLAQAELLSTLDAIPDLLFEMGLDGRYYSVRAARNDLLAAPAEVLLGRRVSEVMPQAAAAIVMAALQEADANGYSIGRQFELPLSTATKWFELSVARKATAATDGQRFVVLSRDITERKQAEAQLLNYQQHLEALVAERTRELELAKEAAESANRAKSVFLANMSHELRTPLNAILGFAQIMARDPRIPEDERSNLATINRSGAHLLALINDVLEISRIEAGRTTLQHEAFDLPAAITAVEEMIRVRADAKGLAFTVDRGELPSYVLGDAHHLRQVLINLLGNAVRYTDQGRIALSVTALTDDRFRFDVADSGPGIPAEEQERIFQAFYQTASGIAKSEGTGLGLTISRQFVRLMGGELTVASEPGQGSTFSFTIALPPTASPTESGPRGHVVGLAAGQASPRILVAEDNPDSQRVVELLLTQVGCRVCVAGNGREAVELFQTWQPQLVLMDMRMPAMDGYQATRAIRALPGGGTLPIVALTASAFEEDRGQVIAAGCDEMIRKPVEEMRLFEVIGRLLGLRFEYEGAAPPPPADARTADLSTLAEDLRQALAAAAASLDTEAVVTIAKSLPADRANEAALIVELANAYRFDRIEEICR